MATGYHHGALRDALLDDGRRLLEERGRDAVTLRELARRAGVSHAAPSRHFADRDALLEALAARGFDELTGLLRTAAGAGDVGSRLATYARAYVRFAVDNAQLLTLMYAVTSRGGARSGPADEAAGRFFALGAELLGEQPGADPGPLPYVLAASLEGIGVLVATGRLAAGRVDEVVDAAVAMLLPHVTRQLSGG